MKKKAIHEKHFDPEAAWRILGLAVKAGKAACGADQADQALRKHEACLILVAGDSSDNTRRKYIPPDREPAVPVRIIGTKELMGKWTGHEERAVVAIRDRGFADRLLELIKTPVHPCDADGSCSKETNLEDKDKQIW